MKKFILLGFVLILLSSFASGVLTDDLVEYYDFENDSGSLGNFSLTSTGESVVSGLIGNAYKLTGDDLVSFGYGGSALGSNSFTLCGWANTTGDADDTFAFIYLRDGSAPTNQVGLVFLAGTLWDFDAPWNSADPNDHYRYSASDVDNIENIWTFFCIMRDSSNSRVVAWVNGSNVGNSTSLLPASYDTGSFQTRYGTDTNRDYQGTIDEVGLWTRRLSQSEITELYNNGLGCTYPFTSCGAPVVSNFSVSAVSNWSTSSISNFSVDIDGDIYSTGNGSIKTNLLQNDSVLYNITFFSDDLFNRSYFNYNVSNNLVGSLRQTQVNVTFKFSTGDLITTPINLTALDIDEFFNVTNGSQILFPDEGISNFSVRCDNEVFAPFNFSLNLTALDNLTFNYTVNETNNVITFWSC